MSRTHVPQCAGIYISNNSDCTHISLPTTNTLEMWAVDAYPCNKYGEIQDGVEYPKPYTAGDFGDCIYLFSVEAGEY